jgi:hypothetical protein
MIETMSTLVAETNELAAAMRAGHEAGSRGDDDTIPEEVSAEWADYYYRGYIEGAQGRDA